MDKTRLLKAFKYAVISVICAYLFVLILALFVKYLGIIGIVIDVLIGIIICAICFYSTMTEETDEGSH